MGTPALVVYVRHGESESNVLAEETGSRDAALKALGKPVHAYDLTPRGRLQAKHAGDHVRATFGAFDAVYVSTNLRTQQTCEAMGYAPWTFDDSRINETTFGIHHFYTREEIESRYPGEMLRLRVVGDYHYAAPGGEDWPSVELRANSFHEMLCREHDGERILMVSHGNFFKAWRRTRERLTVDAVMALTGSTAIVNCGVAHYAAEPDAKGRVRLAYKGTVNPWAHDGACVRAPKAG